MGIEIKFEKLNKTINLDETISSGILKQNFDIMRPLDADSGNPFAVKLINPAIASPLCQDSKRFPSVDIAPGNIVTMNKGINELTEDCILRSHEINNKTKEYKKAGKGVPFCLTPLYLQKTRFWKTQESKEICSSSDSFKPNHDNSWGSKTCVSCPKNITKDRKDKCSFCVPVYYIGGTYDKLLKANFKGTNTDVFFKQLLPHINKNKPMYLVTFLMDTEMKEDKEGHKWYVFKVLDTAKTPEPIIKMGDTIRQQLEIYFDARNSSATSFNVDELETTTPEA